MKSRADDEYWGVARKVIKDPTPIASNVTMAIVIHR